MRIVSKKGLSPLIAAVLLIVVVVGIGAVITGLVREQITSDKETIDKGSRAVECSAMMEIEVPLYLDDYRICLSGSDHVNFTIENIGSVPVDDIQVKFFGSEDVYNNDSILPSGLAEGELVSNIGVWYNTSEFGTLQEIAIVPLMKVPGDSRRLFCSDAELRFSGIKTC